MVSLQSLRMRLGLLLVLAFAPVFALTAYWSYLDRASRVAAREASESQLVRHVATMYGQVIARSRAVLLTSSRLTEVKQLDGPGCTAILGELLRSFQPQYASLAVARVDGQVFCSAPPVTRPIDISGSQAFVRAVETRGFAVGDFSQSRVNGRPVLTMAFPVVDERSEIVAVMSALLSVDWFNQLGAELSMRGSLLLVVDRSGRVVVRQPDPAAWVGRDVSDTPLFAALLRGEAGLEAVALDGVRRRFAIASVDGVPPPAFLAVAVGYDQAEAVGAFHGALLRDLGFLCVVAFAALAAAWVGTERVVIRRVRALLTATRRLAAGDLSARTGAGSGPSELRQLGRAFDDMASALEQRDVEMNASRKALAEQEALLRTVIDTLPVGVWIIDAGGEITAANQQAREIWGLAQPDDGHDQDQAWWTADERIGPQGRGIARALLSGEQSSNEIFGIGALDGTRKTIAQWAVPLRDAEGEIAGAVAVNQDITARIQAEAALRESEERFRNMAEHLPLMLWLTDATGAATYINQKWYDYTGQTPGTALGFGWIEALHPDDAPGASETFLAANAMRVPFVLEYRVRRHDGEYRHFIDPAAPRLGPAGEFLGYVGCVIDIHDRELAGEHLRLAVEAAPSAMIMADERGVITLVNNQTEQLFGYTRAELLGQPVEMLLPQRLRARHLEDREDFFRAPAARKMGRGSALVGQRKDGSEVPVEIGLNPVRTDAGGFVLASIADVTERRHVEEARARLEGQLRQAQKMEALGTLAGGIAHDFNNILSAIICNVELAGEDVGADHAAQESLSAIREASTRARDLVQQILAFSRQQPLECRVVQLRDVAEETVKMLRATLPAGVDLVCDFSPDAPHVLADHTHMHQVLMNLCANAWQSMEGGVGRIEISLAGMVVDDDAGHAVLRPGRYARLTVADTGKGMDDATVERIFEPFFTTKALGEGTGLGLAVVDGVVRNHDGAVEVFSTPGQGTIFHLYFPAVAADTEAVAAPRAELPCGRGQRILYLDDEPALVAVAKRLLGRLGYDVKGFTRPADALAAFRADPTGFDACVTDLNMPTGSGLEIATEILRVRPDLPVAVCSGNVTEALRTRAHAMGIREVLYKPSTLSDLAEVIQRMVTGEPDRG
jgi:two-component system cell cycle sensor histidine kinase/response regulator CckA